MRLLKLSIDIADEFVCKSLEELARMVGVSIEDLVKTVICSSAIVGKNIIYFLVVKKPFRIKDKLKKLNAAFKFTLNMGFEFYLSFVHPLLKHFKVVGHYYLETVEAGFDDGTIYFYFSQVRDSPLYVNGIYLWLEGLNGSARIATETFIDENTPEEIFNKLDELRRSYEDEIWDYEGFRNLEDISIYLDNIKIIFEVEDENYKYLPPVTKISNIIEKILIESGI